MRHILHCFTDGVPSRGISLNMRFMSNRAMNIRPSRQKIKKGYVMLRIPVMASAHLTAAATQLSTSHSRKEGGKMGLPVWACKLCSTQGKASTNSLGT